MINHNNKKEKELTFELDKEKGAEVIPFEKPKLLKFDTTDTPPEDWLSELVRGTVFLARATKKAHEPKDLILNTYFLREHKVKTSNMTWATPDGRQLDIWVPRLEFSRAMELVEVLDVVELKYNDTTEDTTEDTDMTKVLETNSITE